MDNQEPTINIVRDEFSYVELAQPQPKRRSMLRSKLRGLADQFKKIHLPQFGRMRRPNPLSRPSGFSFNKKPAFIALAVLILLIIGLVWFLSHPSKQNQANAQSDKKAEIPDAKARQVIAQNFDFPILDNNGKEVTKLHYSIENAELHDQIVVQGQKASAVQGKTFLVINIKITNDYDKPIQLNTKDYLRLTRNGSNEQLAADIHNDPVTIQPISTKYTRLGFAINENDQNLELHVGEINGPKTSITIHF